jgi:hypothetical protein
LDYFILSRVFTLVDKRADVNQRATNRSRYEPNS